MTRSGKKWVLMPGGGPYQVHLVRELKKAKCNVLVVDANENAPAFAFADYFFVHSAWDWHGIENWLVKNKFSAKIKAVMTAAARGCIVTTAVLAQKYGCQGLNPQTALFFNSKRDSLKELNASTAVFELLPGARIPEENLSFPIVVKRENKSGATGLTVLHDFDQLAKYRNDFSQEPLLLEPYISGRHLGILGLVNAHQIKIYGVVERILDRELRTQFMFYPAELAENDYKKIVDLTESLLHRTNFNFGPFNLEIILQPDGDIHFVELEASLPGSNISEYLIPMAGKNDMVQDYIDLSTTGKFNSHIQPNPFTIGQRFFYPQSTGVLDHFYLEKTNFDMVVKNWYSSGSVIPSDRLPMLQVIAVGKNYEDVHSRLNALQFKMEMMNVRR